jgi:hypothetical protein
MTIAKVNTSDNGDIAKVYQGKFHCSFILGIEIYQMFNACAIFERFVNEE